MKSKRSHEGYLLVDNRACLGEGGLPNFTEAATITCSHCQTVLIVNPLRTRERAYCPKCDHYLCDTCGAVRAANGGACVTFKQIIAETQEQAVRDEQRGIIVVPQ